MNFAVDARLIGGTSTGDSTYWTSLLYGLSQIEVTDRILFISNVPKPANIPWTDRFEWICAPSSSSRWWSLVTLPNIARKFNARSLHTQYALSPLAKRGITTIHDVSFFVGPEWFRLKDRVLLRLAVPAAARKASRIIAVSNFSAGEILKFIPVSEGKIRVTPLACPPWIESVDAEIAKPRLAERLGIRGPFILTVGTRWPRKNMGLAVQACSGLRDQTPHKLVVTGKQGWGSKELGKRGLATGYVDTETLSDLYSCASLYLAPSLHEGFGIPVLEAFRCGAPVMASSGGSLPETVGSAGIVLQSWDPSQWTASIESALCDPSTLDLLRAQGRERERLFSWENTARATLDVYREVAR